MKVLKDVLKVLTFILTLGTVAVFFFDFAAVTVSGLSQAIGLKGVDLAFGGAMNFTVDGVAYNPTLAKSGYYLFLFVLSVFSAALAGFGFKKTGSSVAGMIFSVITGIMFCVIAAGDIRYIDARKLNDIGAVTGASMQKFVWIAAALSFAAAVVAIAALLVQDYIKAKATGGKTVPKRVVRFLRDYNGELKKITWPKFGASLKNTVIVIVISVIIGAFVWLLDWGLSALIDLGLGL
ncbi:MAG: preprotein translocase subunit SecE [Acutalibacteraceae bacterium]